MVFSDISQRKEAAAALAVAHAHLRTIMETAQVAILVAHDAQCRRVTGNGMAHALLGVPLEGNLSGSPGDPQDAVPWRALRDGRELAGDEMPMQQAARTGQAISDLELEIVRATGERVAILCTAAPLRNAAGVITGAVGTVLDITERKRAEEAMRESEKRLAADLAALTRMHALSGWLSEAGEFQPLLEEIMEAAVAIAGAERGTLQLLEGDSLRIVAHHGHEAPFLEFFASAESRASVCGEATKRGERVVVPDVELSALFAGMESLRVLREAGVRAVQSTPMMSRGGVLLGILTTQWGRPHSPDEHDLWRIDLLVRQAADMIEQAAAERALRAAQNTFAELIERSPFGTYIVDSQFRITLMNASSQTGAFRNVRPVVGRLFDEAMRILWPEPVAGEIIGHFRHTLETGEPFYSRDFVRPRSDVKVVEAYEWELHRMKLPDGQHGVICYYYDSTKLREAEAAILESEERLRLLVDGTKDYALLMLDPQGHITTWNEGARRLKGYESEEVIGRHFSLFYAPEDVAAGKPTQELEVAEREGKYEEEGERMRKDGSRFWASVHISPLRDEQGRLRGFSKVTRDITERKQAEEALRASETRFGSIVSSAMDAIISVDADQRIVLFNAAAERMFGHRAHEAVGQPLSMLLPADRRAVHEQHVRGFAATGVTARQMGALGELVGLRADGEQFPLEASISQIEVAGGKVLTVILRDITERKRAEAALRESEAQFRGLADSIPNLAWWANGDGYITWYNRRWYEVHWHNTRADGGVGLAERA